MEPVRTADDAIRAATDFLLGQPGAEGPFSVRDYDQDFYVVVTQADDGSPIMVCVDRDGAFVGHFLGEDVVDVALIRPE